MDLVPCHTSIEHPWFREHPDWYVWRRRRAAEQLASPPSAARPGAPARRPLLPALVLPRAARPRLAQPRGRGGDAGRRPLLARARRRRLPARRDRPADEGPASCATTRRPRARRRCRCTPSTTELAPVHSRNAPDIGTALAAIREAAGDALLVGEVYLPSAALGPYLRHLDRAFAFELLHSPWEADALRAAIARRRAPADGAGLGDVEPRLRPRCPTRFGPENARAAALLLLTLPGPAFIYQGDEIGQGEGPDRHAASTAPGATATATRCSGTPRRRGGFTTGKPWLPLVDPPRRNVADQRDDPGSLLRSYRELIALRRELRRRASSCSTRADGVLAFRRGGHTVAINTTAEPPPRSARGEPRIQTDAPGALDGHLLAATCRTLSRWVRAAPSAGVRRRGEERSCRRHHRRSRDARCMPACGVRCRQHEGGGGRTPSTGTSSTSPAAPTTRRWQTATSRPTASTTSTTSKLPTDANQQREQLVRRLAAQGQEHRPDRHGRDLDRRVRRGRLDPAVDRRRTAQVATRASSKAPLKTARTRARL